MQHRQRGRVAHLACLGQILALGFGSATFDEQLEGQRPQDAVGSQHRILALEVLFQWLEEQGIQLGTALAAAAVGFEHFLVGEGCDQRPQHVAAGQLDHGHALALVAGQRLLLHDDSVRLLLVESEQDGGLVVGQTGAGLRQGAGCGILENGILGIGDLDLGSQAAERFSICSRSSQRRRSTAGSNPCPAGPALLDLPLASLQPVHQMGFALSQGRSDAANQPCPGSAQGLRKHPGSPQLGGREGGFQVTRIAPPFAEPLADADVPADECVIRRSQPQLAGVVVEDFAADPLQDGQGQGVGLLASRKLRRGRLVGQVAVENRAPR